MPDDRFNVARDARFKQPRRQQHKVKIDKRFEGMFKDKDFVSQSSVDKRGKKVRSSHTQDDLQRYYALEDDDEVPKAKSKGTQKTADEEGEDDDDDDEDEDDDEDDDDAEKDDEAPDYARGEGLVSSSDEDDSDEDSSDDDDDGADDDAPEIDPQLYDEVWAYAHGEKVELTEEATSRLAVCNLDWDSVRAVDLFAIFSSFKSDQGVIRKVTIYPSDYGQRCMAKEQEIGPMMGSDSEDEGLPIPEVKEDKSNEKEVEDLVMRRYQVRRMRYFYAVVECDTVATAQSLYSACDGLEFETSSNEFDLRFIPNDTEFDQTPRESCTSVPSGYTPHSFYTKSLQQSRVAITWDEGEPAERERLEKLTRHFSKDDMLNADLQEYLSSSSDSAEEEEGVGLSARERRTAAMKDLLQHAKELEKQNKKQQREWGNGEEEEEEGDMEITFTPALREKVSDAVKRKEEREKDKELSVWEKVQKKRREKKRGKKKEKEQGSSSEEEESDDERFANDPYFAEELKNMRRMEQSTSEKDKKKKKKSKKTKGEEAKEETEEERKEREGLELLMMEEGAEGNKAHFDLKDIMNKEKKNKKKKNKKGKESAEEEKGEDGFEVDLKDERFSALFSSSEFALDPTSAEFKKTKNMEKVMGERRKRREGGGSEGRKEKRKREGEGEGEGEAEVQRLVAKLKKRAKSEMK